MAVRAPGELTRLYLTNTVAHVLLKVVAAVVGLWAARELVRALGGTGFGLVTLASALAGYLSFLGLGLPSGLVRQVADLSGRGEQARLRRLVRLALALFGAIGLAAGAAVATIALSGALGWLAIPDDAAATARAALLATAAVVAVSWPLSVFSATLTGMQRLPAQNAVSAAGALAAALLSVAVARRGGGPAGVILATGGVLAATGAIQGLLLRRALRGSGRGEPAGGALSELRPVVSFGAWVLALEVAALLIYQTDQILLGVFVSVESLAAYYVAARLHNLLREGNGVLGAALFPLIAEESGRGNRAAVEQAIYRGSRYSAAVVLPATIAVVLLAGPFLRVWMGEEWVYLTPLAQAFASYFVLAALTSVAGQVALGVGESAVLGKIALATALVNLAVSLALVRPWGIGGVIAGTLVAYALGVPAQILFLLPRLGVSRRRFFREAVAPVYGVVLPIGAAWWAIGRVAAEPAGIATLCLRGALIVGSCWAALWFSAVDPHDRRRLLARALPGREARS